MSILYHRVDIKVDNFTGEHSILISAGNSPPHTQNLAGEWAQIGVLKTCVLLLPDERKEVIFKKMKDEN